MLLVGGALTFAALERDSEVQIRFRLSETRREFAKQFNIGGDNRDLVFARSKINVLIIVVLFCFRCRGRAGGLSGGGDCGQPAWNIRAKEQFERVELELWPVAVLRHDRCYDHWLRPHYADQ